MTLSRRAADRMQASREPMAALRALDAELTARADDTIAVGDLFVDDASAAEGVQWAVVATQGDHFLIVPVDAMSWIGDGDLEAREKTTGARLVLRARSAVWTGPLEDVSRCGRLPPEDVSRVAARAAGGVSARSAAASDIDADPEHRAWMRDVVTPLAAAHAADRLPESPARDRAGQSAKPETARPWTARPWTARPWTARPWTLAASLLVGLGLGWMAHRISQPVDGGGPAPDEPPQVASVDTVVRELPLAFLAAQETLRGWEDEALVLDAASSRFALALSLDPLALAERYRVRIVALAINGTEDAIVAPFEIVRGERLFLSLALASDAFVPGRYRVYLEAEDRGEQREMIYGFALRRPSTGFQAP